MFYVHSPCIFWRKFSIKVEMLRKFDLLRVELSVRRPVVIQPGIRNSLLLIKKKRQTTYAGFESIQLPDSSNTANRTLFLWFSDMAYAKR